MSRYYKSSAEPLGGIALGESFTSICSNPMPPARPTHLSLTDPPAFSRTKLPPAVANVPPGHIRGYLHHKKVSHYLVGSTLGEGSFAKVKEAFHVLIGEKVAMKVIDKKKAQKDPYVAKNFRREAKLLQMVRHPNILQLLEVIETDTSFYLITELCSGGELMKYIYKKGQLDEMETRKYMRHIVSAVDHLHKAGIIHRDLKVENLLLDANLDIKLIDFGLSNEEFVQNGNGVTHCSTQCGSPAYAAPELLGQKKYSPQVDIWSIGVNMYAMLTGSLPYTVEPFSITALHAKMLENKMNPIPDHLSKSCKDLLKNLLKSNPDDRMRMAEIMRHPWMNKDHALPFGPAPSPNKLEVVDLDNDIIQHMVHTLKVKDSEDKLRQELVSNRATQAAAVYHLMLARLARYKKQFKNSSSHVQHRTSQLPRDQGDDDDIQSVKSTPTSRPSPGYDDDNQSVKSTPTRRLSNRPGHVPVRNTRPQQLKPTPKDCPISHPSLMEAEEVQEKDTDLETTYNYHRRRSSMPDMMLKDSVEELCETRHNDEESKRKEIKNAVTYPSHRSESNHNGSPHDTNTTTTAGGIRRIPTQLDAHRRAGVKLPSHKFSTPARLNHLRLNTHPGNHNKKTPHVIEAWCATPTSRNNTSHEPSQHVPLAMTRALSTEIISTRPAHFGNHSRTASFGDHSRAASFGDHNRAASFGDRSRAASLGDRNRAASFGDQDRTTYFCDQGRDENEIDDLTFHEVGMSTFPRSSKTKSKKSTFVVEYPSKCSNNTLPLLPSITLPQATGKRVQKTRTTWGQQGIYSKRSKNGYHSHRGIEHKVDTELDVDKVVKEIQKVVHSFTIQDTEREGARTVLCTCNGMKIQITVSKEQGTCKLNFQWISGGDLTSYNKKRERIAKMLNCN